ncbi:hypothetical protein KFK09_028562 [Dendrobium nobile]|uniref:Uncharacterized protein n=1 Tax=Dendrobium nobile TaxID=94219 RepID=A0A8T3A7Z1_DENNO|nr:hypothetical protein KFK09_028562 [Dendrobium nobile]
MSFLLTTFSLQLCKRKLITSTTIELKYVTHNSYESVHTEIQEKKDNASEASINTFLLLLPSLINLSIYFVILLKELQKKQSILHIY